MGWITDKDDPKAQALEKLWEGRSEQAREFAILHGGLWPGILPHVVAEIYDASVKIERERILQEIDLMNHPGWNR